VSRRSIVLGLLSVGMVIAYIDRTNLSVALASAEFKDVFRLSDTERGLLNSAFFWTYAALQIPAGFVTDRYGVRLPYAASFLLWSSVSAAAALAGSFWQLFVLRLLLGIGEAIVTPASLRWIRLNIEERHRGMAVGILFAGAKVGPAVGAYLSTQLLQAYGWRAMFVILGLGCLVFLMPWMKLVRDDDREIEQKQTAAPFAFRRIWTTPAIYGILIGTFAYNYFNYFCMTWLPAYLVEQWKLSLEEMSIVTAASFLGFAAVAIAAGAAADWFIRRGGHAIAVRKTFTIAGLLVASSEVVGSFTDSRTVALAFAIVSLTGLGLTTANYWALTQSLMPGAGIGRIAGVQNFASNVSGIIAPALTGWLVQVTGAYHAPLRAALVILIAGIAAYLFLVREKYAPRS
jgi:MFS family permease